LAGGCIGRSPRSAAASAAVKSKSNRKSRTLAGKRNRVPGASSRIGGTKSS
jgi:hypothetical protein